MRWSERRKVMKKNDNIPYAGESYIMAKDAGNGSTAGKGEASVRKSGNIYLDAISSLMEKNTTRVSKYYCANTRCPGNFWSSDLGYRCPKCGSIGLISEFKAEIAQEEPEGPVLGYLDSIGRIFCNECAERFRLGDDINFIIYGNTEPFNHQTCEVCRSDLTITS
jgi:hypothetical protein